MAAGFMAGVPAGTAAAQEAGADEQNATQLPELVLTANRTPTEKSKVGSKVEQVGEAEIEAKARPVVSDYLNLLPGVSVTANGGLGTQSGLFVRGLGSKYVKTLYNGIDVSDPTNTQVQTHYEYLLTGGASNIEVLKGSQGTLYGSSAIAGLIDISTLGQAEEGVHHVVEAEGGSFGTVRGRYGLTAVNDRSRFAANVTGLHTDGISAADGFPERDGFDNATLDVTAEHRINEAFSVFGSALYIDAKGEFDGYDSNPPYGLVDNLTNENHTKTTAGRIGFNLDLMDGRLKNTVSAQGFKMDRSMLDSGSEFSYVGKRAKLDYQGSFEATERFLVQYGADYEHQTADVQGWTSFSKSYDLTGVWAQAIVEPVDDLTLTAGLRHDEHSVFGGDTTYRGTASYLFADTGTRLHSSLGTGFRAPSLYELYDPSYGTSTLKPENSVSFDAGVEQAFLGGRFVADVTYFRLTVDDLIDYDFSTSKYNQVSGTTRSQGVEASFTYAATDWLDLGGSYTYTDSRKPDGSRSVLVPKHAVVLSANARPAEKWTVGADLKFVADTVDSVGKLGDYTLLNAKVAYQLTDTTEVYLRGENLLNEHYQTVRGYGTPGISAFAGIRAKF